MIDRYLSNLFWSIVSIKIPDQPEHGIDIYGRKDLEKRSVLRRESKISCSTTELNHQFAVAVEGSRIT